MDKSRIGSAAIFSAAFIVWFLFIGPALDKKFAPPKTVIDDVEATEAASDKVAPSTVTDLDNPQVVKSPEPEKEELPKVEPDSPKAVKLPEVKVATTFFDAVIDPQEASTSTSLLLFKLRTATLTTSYS